MQVALAKVLIEDARILIKALTLAKEWKSEDDRKLNALMELITKTHKKDKILIFTQYADTANYIHHQLQRDKIEQNAVVTGDADNPTHFAHRFSPRSNEKPDIANTDKELRILVSTDVLSEGQNLHVYETGPFLQGK